MGKVATAQKMEVGGSAVSTVDETGIDEIPRSLPFISLLLFLFSLKHLLRYSVSSCVLFLQCWAASVSSN